MKIKIFNFLLLVFFPFLGLNAQIATWNYEPLIGSETSPTANIGTGSSSVVNLGGGTIGSIGNWQATGMTGSGCGSQNGVNAWALNPFNPGSSNESNGAQFNVSTLGNQNIIVTWDHRFSNTAPNTVRLQYTIDGNNWINFNMTTANTTICAGTSINSNGCFENNAGDVYRRVQVDLSTIPAVNNNANFGVRIVAAYFQSTQQFRQCADNTLAAGSSGTWRFDNVSFYGTPTTTGAVLSGSATICSGSSANISVSITGGTAPYTVIYSPNGGTTQLTSTNYTTSTPIVVSPSSTTTYTLVSVKDSNNNLITPLSGSAVINVNAPVIPTITSSASSTICSGTTIVYTTESGKVNYNWTFFKGAAAAVLNTDYTIVSGAANSNSISIQWLLTSGTATFTASVNYSFGGCAGTTASNSVTIYALPTTPSWVTAPSGTICANTAITYKTTSGKFNYVWNISGVLGTDYTITGGTNTSDTAVISWLTSGSKTVTVNYSNQTMPDCQSLTAATNTITVFTSPTITSFGPVGAQTICAGSTFTPLTVVTAGSGTLTYTWYKKNPALIPTGYSGNTATYSSYTPTLPASVGYYVTVSNGVCAAVASATIGPFTITPASQGGTASSDQTICGNTMPSASITLASSTGSIQWQMSTTSSTTGFNNINGATTTSLLPSQVGNLNTTTYIRAVVTNGICTSAYSNVVTITITAGASTGTVSADQTICSNTTPSDLSISNSVGSIQWQSSTTSSTSGFTNIVGATSATLLGSTIGNLSVTTYYRALLSYNSCTPISSNVITVTVAGGTNAGVVSGSSNVCSAVNSTTLTLTGFLGNVLYWQSASDSLFTSGVTILSNTTPTLIISNCATTTYYRAVVQNGNCVIAYSVPASITFSTTTWSGIWSNGAPSITKQVIFNSNYNSAGNGTGNLNACSLKVNANINVVVTAGDTFTVQNEVEVANAPASLTFQDTSSLIQVNSIGVTNLGKINYFRNSMPMKKYDYTYWASPVANQSLINFSPNTLFDKYFYWNTSINYWVNAASSSIMTAGKGYIIRAPDVSPFNLTSGSVFSGQFYGTPNNGTISTYIFGSLDVNYNLIGNPYPSAIDADAFLNYNSVTNGGVLAGTLYLWTHNTPITNYMYTSQDYAVYNLTGGVGTIPAPSNPCTGCNNSIPNGKIAAGQSFFIEGLADGYATFKNEMRFGTNAQFFKNTNSNANTKNRFWLDLYNDSGLFKQVLIGYISGATNEYDPNYDGPIMEGGNPIMFYSIVNDKKLSIQGRTNTFSVNDEINLGYKTTNAGVYAIKLSNFEGLFLNQEIYIKDSFTNEVFNLRMGDYSFSTDAGTFDNRFKLIFTNTTLATNLQIPNSEGIMVYKSANTIHVKSGSNKMSEVVMYDIQGRTLQSYTNINLSEFQFPAPTESQIVVLKISTQNGTCYYKKI
jgi:hypothetical protein